MNKLWRFTVWILSWIYRIVVLKFFSFWFNAWYIGKMIVKWDIFKILKEKKKLKLSIENISDVLEEVGKFEYKFDGFYEKEGVQTIFSKWPTWIPRIFVFIYRGKKGNCEDAAFYSRWLFKVLEKKQKLFKTSVEVFVPTTMPKTFTGVHYILEVKTRDKTLKKTFILSNGKLTNETKDNLAMRWLNTNKYIWM